MWTHSNLWRAIDQIADNLQLTVSGLAKLSQLSPTTLSPCKRFSKNGRPRWPSTESIGQILHFCGLSMKDFIGLMNGDDRKLPYLRIIHLSQIFASDHFTTAGEPTGNIWASLQLTFGIEAQPDDYGIIIDDKSLYPVFNIGDILLITPSMGLRNGDLFIAKLYAGPPFIARLTKQTSMRIEFEPIGQLSFHEQQQTQKPRSILREHLLWTARLSTNIISAQHC